MIHCTINQTLTFLHILSDALLMRLKHFEMVIPIQVDKDGLFVSYALSPVTHDRVKRDTYSSLYPSRAFYNVSVFGKEFHFHMKRNDKLTSQLYRAEVRSANGIYQTPTREANSCHYIGYSKEPHLSQAAISNCFGLVSIISI